jgi:5-formyltetrahydrofolate cyclo-ligase
MRAMRLDLSADEVARRSAVAAAHLLALPEVEAAGRVALFASVRNEIDTRPVDAALRARGATVLYPRVAGATLAFAAVDSRASLVAGDLGIPEPPADAQPVPVEAIDVFVIPGLAFDTDGERLGWGRGHYDRTLAAAPAALRVGYAYDFQLVPIVPANADDERVDVVVTCRGACRTTTRRPR